MWAHGTTLVSMAKAFGREWMIGCMCHVWACACVSVYSLQQSLGWSLHFINKSVKKQSIVCWTVRTMFGDLKVCPTLNSEMKYSSLNCPNQVGWILHWTVPTKLGELILCPIKNRLKQWKGYMSIVCWQVWAACASSTMMTGVRCHALVRRKSHQWHATAATSAQWQPLALCWLLVVAQVIC